MELGSGIALAGLCISGGAVAITAIRTFGNRPMAVNGRNGINGKNGSDACSPCKDHSGVIACLDSIEKSQDRHEKWMETISLDVKSLLARGVAGHG